MHECYRVVIELTNCQDIGPHITKKDCVGNLVHILLYCPGLSQSRENMIKLWSSFLVNKPSLFPVIRKYTIEEPNLFPQFLLDPSCLPFVISTNDSEPDTLQQCLYLTRTWCFSTHILRSKLLLQLNIK